MKDEKTTEQYGLWESALSIEAIFSQPAEPLHPFKHQGQLYWLQSLPDEGGRVALMKRLADGEVACLTPAPFNIRSGVHEYGGRCFALHDQQIYFNHYAEGRIYSQSLLGGDPIPITSQHGIESKPNQFADLIISPDGDTLIAVVEIWNQGSENENALVAIALDQMKQVEEGAEESLLEAEVLIRGADFYASPVISPDGNTLAWIEWVHPYMPWDQSRLKMGRLIYQEGRRSILNQELVMAEKNHAVCQPGFLSDGSLIYIMDGDSPGSSYWDFYRFHSGEHSRLTDDESEYGEAHWQFGQSRWVEGEPGQLIAVRSCHSGDELVEIDVHEPEVSALHQGFSSCAHLSVDAMQTVSGIYSSVVFLGRYSTKPVSLFELQCRSGKLETLQHNSLEHGQNLDIVSVCEPQHICFPTRDNEKAYAWFYRPYNVRYQALDDTLPPLLVMIHGGPTGRASSDFNSLKHYFSALGFAVLDVNHRGSTGFGRSFRQRLLGEWGVVDVNDLVDGIHYVSERGWVDSQSVFIRGGSAGGYAVLRGLTEYPTLFSGGACYYGIGNLITLSEITHKFEGRYTDGLIGESYDPHTATSEHSQYTQRSPVNSMDSINCPLILFQGLNDKVVPPDVSREVAEILKNKGMKYEYIEYEGEGHGFRKTETRIDALEKESKFFQSILKTLPTTDD